MPIVDDLIEVLDLCVCVGRIIVNDSVLINKRCVVAISKVKDAHQVVDKELLHEHDTLHHAGVAAY